MIRKFFINSSFVPWYSKFCVPVYKVFLKILLYINCPPQIESINQWLDLFVCVCLKWWHSVWMQQPRCTEMDIVEMLRRQDQRWIPPQSPRALAPEDLQCVKSSKSSNFMSSFSSAIHYSVLTELYVVLCNMQPRGSDLQWFYSNVAFHVVSFFTIYLDDWAVWKPFIPLYCSWT